VDREEEKRQDSSLYQELIHNRKSNWKVIINHINWIWVRVFPKA
jgi:hypothetical protein